MLMTKGVREPFLATKQTSKYVFSLKSVYIVCSYPITASRVIYIVVMSDYIYIR